MSTSLIKSQIKRATKNLFLVNLILLILSISLLVYYWSEFHNNILGPKEVKIGEISNLKINGLTARNYVKVSLEKKASTGLEYDETEYDENCEEKSKTVNKVYYVLKDGQDLIIAAIPSDNVNKSSYTGWVKEITPKEKEYLNVGINKLKSTGNFTASEYILDAYEDSSAPFWYVACGVIIIISIINICKCIKWINFPEEHKIYKKLLKYGNVDEIISSIEEELPYDLFPNNKKIYFLKSWMLSPKFFSLDVNKIDNVVWAYKRTITHSIYSAPTGKTHELVFCFYNKSKCSIGLKENQIDKILTSIKQMYPWVIVGFTYDLQGIWKSNFQQLTDYVQAEKQKTIDNY